MPSQKKPVTFVSCFYFIVMTRGKDVTEGRVQVIVQVHRVAEGEKRGMEAMAIEVPLYSVLKGTCNLMPLKDSFNVVDFCKWYQNSSEIVWLSCLSNKLSC